MPGTAGQPQVPAMLDYLLGRATPGPDESARQDAHGYPYVSQLRVQGRLEQERKDRHVLPTRTGPASRSSSLGTAPRSLIHENAMRLRNRAYIMSATRYAA
jgi:hypothetical protein